LLVYVRVQVCVDPEMCICGIFNGALSN